MIYKNVQCVYCCQNMNIIYRKFKPNRYFGALFKDIWMLYPTVKILKLFYKIFKTEMLVDVRTKRNEEGTALKSHLDLLCFESFTIICFICACWLWHEDCLNLHLTDGCVLLK